MVDAKRSAAAIGVVDSMGDELLFAEGVRAAAESLRDDDSGIGGVIFLIDVHIERLRAIKSRVEKLHGFDEVAAND